MGPGSGEQTEPALRRPWSNPTKVLQNIANGDWTLLTNVVYNIVYTMLFICVYKLRNTGKIISI